MNTIVTALDLQGNTHLVVEKALDMAERLNAQLHLVHVIAPVGTYITTNMVDPLSGVDTTMLANELDIVDSQKQIAQEQLDKIASELLPAQVVAKVLIGPVEEEVANYAQEINAIMIVVGTHHRRGLARLIYGETSVRILHESQIPILVIPTIDKK